MHGLSAAAPIVVHVNDGGGWPVVLSIVLAALTAAVALAALIYARRTVVIAAAARVDATNAHREEMADRVRMADVELRVHRIARAEDTLGIATEIRDAAIADLNGKPGVKLQYPALATRLRSSLAALTALGGPALPNTVELGDITPQGGVTSERIQQASQTAAQEIERAISADAALRLDWSPEP